MRPTLVVAVLCIALVGVASPSYARVDQNPNAFELTNVACSEAGLAFVGNCAIVGLSLARENRTFSGLQLDETLQTRGTIPRCGLAVIDLNRGDMIAWARIEGVVRELYDDAVIPSVKRATLIGFKTDEVRFVISVDTD